MDAARQVWPRRGTPGHGERSSAPIVKAHSASVQCYFDAYLLRDRHWPGLLITLKHVEILVLRITGGKGYTTTS
jgi:hypothetical protein